MTLALRTAMIWHDEVMHDVVLTTPSAITLGADGATTFTVPDLGLPARFAIVRPGNRGYLLTLGERMRGTISIDGVEQSVQDFVSRGGDGDRSPVPAGPGGFRATALGSKDWGVIELDETGAHKLFFSFVQVDDPAHVVPKKVQLAGIAGWAGSCLALIAMFLGKGDLDTSEAVFRGIALASGVLLACLVLWRIVALDSDSQLSLAFSVVGHAALLFMTYQLFDDANPFVWPGPRSLTGNYLVHAADVEPPKEEKPTPTVASAKAPDSGAMKSPEPPKKTATKGEQGASGGKGDTERARDPNAQDVKAEVPKVAFFEDKNKKVLDNIIDRNISTNLTKFTGLKGDTLKAGSLGFGPGQGTGVGPGQGTGTTRGSKGKGSGGGGNVEGDFVTNKGPIDTGKNRPGGNCVGAGCTGSGPKEVKVALADPSGDFGGLTADEIDRVVKSRAGVFKACYQKELNRTPGIGGKLVIHFKIGGDGVVQASATAAGTTLHNDTVESCVKSNVMRLKFPAKGGVANVNYPFVFSQGG